MKRVRDKQCKTSIWLNSLSGGKAILLILAVGLVTFAVAVGVIKLIKNDTPEPEPESSVIVPENNETIDSLSPPDDYNYSKTDDVDLYLSQMAGFWRMDYPNPVNAQIMILFDNGTWESPGVNSLINQVISNPSPLPIHKPNLSF